MSKKIRTVLGKDGGKKLIFPVVSIGSAEKNPQSGTACIVGCNLDASQLNLRNFVWKD